MKRVINWVKKAFTRHQHTFGEWFPCDGGRQQVRMCQTVGCEEVEVTEIEPEVYEEWGQFIEAANHFQAMLERNVERDLENGR